MKNNLNKFKSPAIFLISSLSFIFLVWLLVFGKIKAAETVSSFFNKLPQNQSDFVKTTEKVLGEAVQKVRGENVKNAAKKTGEVFETSQIAEPAREIREDVKQKVDETFETIKQLPAKEIKTIQRQICKEWLGDELLATPSGK